RRMAEAATRSQIGAYVVDFPKTLILEASSHQIFRHTSHGVTQFGSLIETGARGSFLTSLSFDHTTLGETYRVYKGDNIRTMAVVHDRNWLSHMPKHTWRSLVRSVLLKKEPKRIRLSRTELRKFALCRPV